MYGLNDLIRNRKAPRSFTGPPSNPGLYGPRPPGSTNMPAPGGFTIQQKKQPAKKKKQSALSKYLASDVDYKNTINDLTKNFQMFSTQNVTNKGNLQQDFNDTKLRLNKDHDTARKNMEADYAARGMFGSGVFQESNNDFNLGFQNQLGDADTSYNRNLSQLLTDLANSKSLFEQQKKDAKLSAIRRRAEKYGIRK